MQNIKILKSPLTKCAECSIRDTALFKEVNSECLLAVQRTRESQFTLMAKSNLYEESVPHDYIYTWYSGWGLLYRTSSSGANRQILRFLLPGDLIGCQTFADGSMSHSAATLTKSSVCSFPRSQFMSLLKDNSDVSLRLMGMEARDMSLCQQHLLAAGRKSAKSSVSFLILELFHRVRIQYPSGFHADTNSIDFPLTQHHIGDAVGITNIHVNRTLKQLIDEKLIVCSKKSLTILNEEKLCEIGEFSLNMVEDHAFS